MPARINLYPIYLRIISAWAIPLFLVSLSLVVALVLKSEVYMPHLLWRITYIIKDSQKFTSAYTKYVLEDQQFETMPDRSAHVTAYAARLGQLLDPLIDGQIVQIRISCDIPLPSGIKTYPLQSRVERGANLVTSSPENRTVRYRIPTWKQLYLFENQGDPLDPILFQFLDVNNLPADSENFDCESATASGVFGAFIYDIVKDYNDIDN